MGPGLSVGSSMITETMCCSPTSTTGRWVPVAGGRPATPGWPVVSVSREDHGNASASSSEARSGRRARRAGPSYGTNCPSGEQGRMNAISEDERKTLSEAAWSVRGNARLHGRTPVGCAVLSDDGQVFAGCNIEHRFRSHDIHAEVNAISTLVAAGKNRLRAILIAAERDRFTPCGSCLDWIFELGGEDCLVLSEQFPGKPTHSHLARDLMPYYPM